MQLNMNSKYENLKIIYNRSKFGWYWAPLYIAFWCLLFYLVVIPSHNCSPKTITNADELAYPNRFIGERAENMLTRLTKIGPRVVGSAPNEQAARDFLLIELGKIKEEARLDLYDIDVDVQISSGNYVIWKMVNMYQSIQNVVVKLQPKTGSNSSLLINSHYDTVPGSSGAGDAGAMVVIMLEVLRVIAKNETPLQHSIIFLFNGAEENPLQGSHAFITQHKWGQGIGAFINLDSAGTGGREILFQTGPNNPWLMKYYGGHILYPFASAVAEEMFSYGFIPSETDYRIFRDFGHIPGLDMAHIFNGYVYHTKYDRYSLIPRRTYQHTGDNILALAKALANAPELEDPTNNSQGNTVFFDVLGWFIIYYSESTGFIINVVVCCASIIAILAYIWNMAHQTGMFRCRIFAKFGILLSIQFAAVLLSILLVTVIMVTIDAAHRSMPWFTNTWLLVGLYFCPMFYILGIIPAMYLSHTKEHGLPLGYSIQLIMHAHCLILTVVGVVMIALGIRSTYLVTISIGFYSLSVIINIVTCFHKHIFLWLIPHIVCQVMPFLFYTYSCYTFYMIFVPIQGRDGAGSNPEIITGGSATVMTLLFAPFLIPLLCIFRKSKIIISIFGIISIISLILVATPVAFPFEEKVAPQRFYAVHTTRTFHNGDPEMSVRRSDSGFYVVPVDRRPNTIDEVFLNLNLTRATKEDCEVEIMCGYPIYSSRWLGWRKQSFWVPGPEPNRDGWPVMKILSKQSTSSTNVLFTLEVSGPDHMSLFIQPIQDSRLVDWSFNKEPLKSNFEPPYFIYHSYALDPTPLRFNMEFERASAEWSGSTFDLAVIGHKVHHDISFTNEFRDFISSFPKWAYVSAWTSSYQSWRL